ncbi:hypothetical protein FBU30_001733 [Linnemannia zychae]|nr:hypothetical protein FBU30_001733 [Linnemannia zychae]
MSSMVTVGIYNGLPADPNAEARKMFTERENQQDGLAAILTYCQNKSGFRPGSNDTTALRQVFENEFWNILNTQPQSVASPFEKSFPNGTQPSVEELRPFFPYEHVLSKYISMMSMGYSYSSIIQFIVQADYRLTFGINQTITICTDSYKMVSNSGYYYFIDRDVMAQRADELMNKLQLRESIGDWAKRITSNGW